MTVTSISVPTASIDVVADGLRHRILSTLATHLGNTASNEAKIVAEGAGLIHVMLQTQLEDFAIENGFVELHDFDELLPDVLAMSSVGVFVGEARARGTLRPGKLDTAQRVEAYVTELSRMLHDARINRAMLALCTDARQDAEAGVEELTRLCVAAEMRPRLPFHVVELATEVWLTHGIVGAPAQ